MATDELAKKGSGTSLHRPGPFCGIGYGFMAMISKNVEEYLRKLYWESLPGKEQSRVLMRGMNPRAQKTV